MTYKEFIAWLEGYVAGLSPDKINAGTISTILGKARSVKPEPTVTENISDNIKKILHG
jgi:hypothetical protein